VRTEKSVMWGVFQWGLVEQERVQVDDVDVSVWNLLHNSASMGSME